MNYEKAYKEALERARQFSEHPLQEDSSSIVEYIFPELKESEDEKIRKALIEYFSEQCDMSDWNGVYGYQVLAWLEKQGEKKPVWNEKDDGYKLVALSAFLNYYDEENPLRKCLIKWLKSLKQRMGG